MKNYIKYYEHPRTYTKKVDRTGIVAQRLKRVHTIIEKLERFPKMKLSQMQDVGGLRTIVDSVDTVRDIQKMYKGSRAKHFLKKEKDYITAPKESGYRGVHLVYENCNQRNPNFNGLLVEIQLRTRLQHIWATTVETVGIFFKESLKSSQGSEMWLEFFKLVSAIFAIEEGEQPHHEFRGKTIETMTGQLVAFVEKNTIFSKLKLIHIIDAVKLQAKECAYLVIESDVKKTTARIYGFPSPQRETASAMYAALEESPACKRGETNVVLVSVEFVKQIEKAYPNFFLDISDFIKELERLCPT